MAQWYNRQPRMVAADLIHPTPQGARIVARLLTGQLLMGYERYLHGAGAGQVGGNIHAAATAGNVRPAGMAEDPKGRAR